MKCFLYLCALALALSGCLLAVGCHSTRPPADTTPVGEPVKKLVGPDKQGERLPDSLRADSVVVQPHRTLVDKVLGRKKVASSPAKVVSDKLPRKCKGCTFYTNSGSGSQNNNTAGKNAAAGPGASNAAKAGAPVAQGEGATAADKTKAPLATGKSEATDQSRTGAASNIKGDNNTPQLTNAPVEAPDWKARLAGAVATPIGIGLSLLVLAGVTYGVYRFVAWRRRKENQA